MSRLDKIVCLLLNKLQFSNLIKQKSKNFEDRKEASKINEIIKCNEIKKDSTNNVQYEINGITVEIPKNNDENTKECDENDDNNSETESANNE